MVRIKKLSLSLLFSLIAAASSLSAMETLTSFNDLDMTNATLEFSPSTARTCGAEENAALFYDKEGFFVREDDNDVRVHGYDTDKFFQGKSVEEMARYAMIGGFKVSQFDNGQYAVRTQGALKGGGVGGATGGFYFGKFLTHFVCHGAIQVAALCTGPAYFATLAGLEGTFMVPIEAASNVVALGFGVAAGVATGPV